MGTGTSHGIPMIGCDCAVCQSQDPHDKRTRVSIVVQYRDVHILVDTSPELRLQCLSNNIRRVDAVLFTHHHADHVTGLDDLRRFNWIQGTSLPCYAQQEDIDAICKMFSYAFRDDPDYPSHKPELDFHAVTEEFVVTRASAGSPGNFATASAQEPSAKTPTDHSRCTVIPIPLSHGSTPVLGYRFGDFAYCTDCNMIGDASLEKLRGLKVLVLDALRRRPHPTHFNIEQAVEWAGKIGAQKTYFTHIAHELQHEPTNQSLPPNMQLAYDGQVIDFESD